MRTLYRLFCPCSSVAVPDKSFSPATELGKLRLPASVLDKYSRVDMCQSHKYLSFQGSTFIQAWIIYPKKKTAPGILICTAHSGRKFRCEMFQGPVDLLKCYFYYCTDKSHFTLHQVPEGITSVIPASAAASIVGSNKGFVDQQHLHEIFKPLLTSTRGHGYCGLSLRRLSASSRYAFNRNCFSFFTACLTSLVELEDDLRRPALPSNWMDALTPKSGFPFLHFSASSEDDCSDSKEDYSDCDELAINRLSSRGQHFSAPQ